MILFRPSGDNPRFAGVVRVDLAAEIGRGSFRNFAHLAFWARAILLLAAADIVLLGRVPFAAAPVLRPASPSITEIASFNFSICDCA